MAGYKEIKGFQVQTRSEDPSPTEVQTGDFYYNSTTGQFTAYRTNNWWLYTKVYCWSCTNYSSSGK